MFGITVYGKAVYGKSGYGHTGYAKRANESGSIYAEDIRDLQKRLDELWEMQKLILKRLSGIR